MTAIVQRGEYLVRVISTIGELDHAHPAAHAGAGDCHRIVDVGGAEYRHRADIGDGVIDVQSALASQIPYPIIPVKTTLTTLTPSYRGNPVPMAGYGTGLHRPCANTLAGAGFKPALAAYMQSVFQWPLRREARYQHVTFHQTHAVWQDEKWT